MKLNTSTASAAALLALSLAAGAASAAQSDHCLRGFSMVDQNDDGMVSKDESSMIVSEEFKAIDENGDGSISKSEYESCQSAADHYGSAPDTATKRGGEESFASTDTNKDEKVDRKEYMQGAEKAYEEAKASGMQEGGQPVAVLHRYIWVVAPESGEAEQGSQKSRQSVEDMSKGEAAGHAAASFSALDSDADDAITKREWKGMAQASGAIEQRFAKFDSNGNGKISEQEFRAAREQSFSEAQSATQAEGQGASGSVPVFHYYWIY